MLKDGSLLNSPPFVVTEEPKAKLKELEKYLPNHRAELHKFGRFLAERLNEEINAMGFVMAYELALHDLHEGVDGFTNKRIDSSLAGHPAILYNFLRLWACDVAQAAFSDAFAQEVEKAYEKIGEDEKKSG